MNPYNNYQVDNNDRCFLAPFLVGGLAGTALGYGISNNNDNNNCCCNNMCPYPIQPIPYSYNNYNTYYPYPYTSNSQNINQLPNTTSSNNFNNYYY